LTHGQIVTCSNRKASLATIEYGNGLSLDREPFAVPLTVCLDNVVSNSVISDGISAIRCSVAAQQSGQAVLLSPVGIG
jgi:hypothetical protein